MKRPIHFRIIDRRWAAKATLEWGGDPRREQAVRKGTEFTDEPVSAVLFFEAFGVGALF